MKKASLIIRGTILLSVIFLSLGVSAEYSESAWKWPEVFTVMTHGPTGETYTLTAVWSPLLGNMTGTKVRQMPEWSDALRFNNLRTGKIDTTTQSASAIAHQTEATDTYATREGGPFQSRILWISNITGFAPMVSGSSSIKTIHDLKPGVKFAYGASYGATAVESANAVAAWAGLQPKDIVMVPFANIVMTGMAVTTGKADVTYMLVTAGYTFKYEKARGGVRYLELNAKKDPEGAKRWLAVKPVGSFGIPSQHKTPPSAKGISMNITPGYYVVDKSMDPELAYHVVKWLNENYGTYKDKHKSSPEISLKSFRKNVDTIYFPLHEGVIKYLKELGQWTSKDDQRQAYNVGLVTRYEKAYKTAIAEADKKGIEVKPDNKAWIALWNSYKKDIPRFHEMDVIP